LCASCLSPFRRRSSLLVRRPPGAVRSGDWSEYSTAFRFCQEKSPTFCWALIVSARTVPARSHPPKKRPAAFRAQSGRDFAPIPAMASHRYNLSLSVPVAESLCPGWQSARLPERVRPRVRTSPMLGFRGPSPHIPSLSSRLLRDSRQKRPREWISSSHGRTA